VTHPLTDKHDDHITRRDTLDGYVRSLIKERETRFPSPFVISAIGGGGKTTILVNLFQQKYRTRSILTTTTAMIAPGHHDRTTNPCEAFRQLDDSLLRISDSPPETSGVWYAHPFPDVPGKYSGIDRDIFDDYIRERREENDSDLVIFCEADGSKRKPLKAHAEHEPVIPRTTDLTLIVFGCAGVGKPLTEQFVHRTDLFSEVIGKEKGEHVEFGDLIALLRSGHFFKGIPRTSRIAVIFNQVDLLPDSLSSNDTLRQWAEDALAISPIDAVFFTSDAGDAHRTEFGLVRPETDSPLFSAVVLAAGLSERMGEENKLLLPLGNTTVLEQTLSRVLKSDIRELIVVLGHEATKVEQSATAAIGTKTPPTMQIKTVFNEHYESGQGTSVACGTRHLSDQSAGCFFVPGDQPFVSPTVMRALAESSENGKIIVPEINRKRTSPALFDRSFYNELTQLDGEKGGREVMDAHEEDTIVLPIECRDKRVSIDIDTKDDYTNLTRHKENEKDDLSADEKKWKLRYSAKVLLFFFTCFPLFATSWAISTYDQVNLNEITFHLFMPIKGTGGGLVLGALIASVLPAIGITLIFALLLYPRRDL
jgi:molybdenum cofactor cytidylyltransferase